MICPRCSAEMDPAGIEIAPPLAICPACEHTLLVTETSARLANSDDVKQLADEMQIIALRKLRQNTAAARRAYFQQHHAH